MTTKTNSELLQDVNTAITAILLGAQEADYNSKKVKKADLEALYKIRDNLIGKIRQDECGGINLKVASFGK